MAARILNPNDLESLVDNMFSQVLEGPERAELLVWIRAWEADNPDVDAAHRITGWIDVAYAFQARSDARQEVRSQVRVATRLTGTWCPVPSTA